MELLKSIRVKAADWRDTNKTVEGTLFAANRTTLEGGDPYANTNGYLLFIIDDEGMKHIISIDTLEIVEMEPTSEVGKAVHASFMKLYKANFTFAQVENFWKDCMSSAEIMIESKKRGLHTQSSISGADLIYLERKRQIEEEGYTPKHDNQHNTGNLAHAASAYASAELYRRTTSEGFDNTPAMWPFERKYWKPSPEDRVKELTKAGALIAAEIDRLKQLADKALNS